MGIVCGQIVHFSELNPNANFYCIEYGINFQEGDYYCYEHANIPNDAAYVIGNIDPTKYSYNDGVFRTDIRQNYLWEVLNGSSHKYDYPGMAADIDALKQEANIVESLNSNSISIINNNGEFITPSADGKFGPFVINYPSVNGKPVGKSFEVLINGQKLTNIPESGKEFYLTEQDGIKLGDKNTIEIKYKATKYTGEMDKFTKIRDARVDFKCNSCGNTFSKDVTAIRQNGQIALDSSVGRVACSCGSYDVDVTNAAFSDGYVDTQDAAIVMVAPENIELEASIEFWAGRKLEIDLTKVDNGKLANVLKDIQFDVTISGDDKAFIQLPDGTKATSTTLTTDSNGESKLTIITTKENITVTFTERDNKFYIDNGPIEIDFTFNTASKTWNASIKNETSLRDVVSIKQEGDWFQFKLKIVNIAKIEDLVLTKLNKSVPGEILPGIEFRITLKNATDMQNNSVIIVKTDSNGNIKLGTLKVTDPNEDIEITLEETGVSSSAKVNYKGLYPSGSAKITIRHAKNGCEVSVTGADKDVINANYDLEKNMVVLEVYNEVTINLSGEVWLDGQTGIKPVKEPDNKKGAAEDRIENIKVVAKRVSDNAVVDTKYTDTNGKYIFEDLPASITGNIQYVIEFTYDGINYIAVTPHIGAANEDSDAQERDRAAFNAKFATITKDKATGTDGTITNLEYDHVGSDAKLKTMDGKDVKPEFAMVATTEPTRYNENTKDIDLGLARKGVDLAAFTELYSATVTINGVSKTYNYNDLNRLNGKLPVNGEFQPSYNLYLYQSDYNYRIGDYKGIGASKMYSEMNPAQSGDMNKTTSDELDVELKYQILLNNQSATTATVNSIAYYYDSKLTLATAISGAVPDGTVYIDNIPYNKILIPVNQTFTEAINQGIAEIRFKVSKSEGSIQLGDMKTWIEITSYSTDSGCIDKDSAPDNIEKYKTEDDTDDARGINIQKNNAQRKISGYVFEDAKGNDHGTVTPGNGTYENGEQKINDVIVQLIEIKKININGNVTKLEYIWQETTTGSNKVKYIPTNGVYGDIPEYNVTNNEGEYTFEGFIPGEYIVRFIYGDGTYWDTAINTQNILKYNGQEYKSTADKYYDKTYFDNNSYDENSSMARDNEARRLHVMGYAMESGRQAEDLKIDDINKFSETWMCAETSLLEIPVSAINSYTSDQDSESTEMPTPSIEDLDDSRNIVIKKINFGLEERPASKLTLEKHVTYVKIEGVAEATADINNYATEEGMVQFSSMQGDSEFSTLSNATSKQRDERGAWTLETQIDKINGKIVIGYKYKVSNNGEHEYIGRALDSKLNMSTYGELETEVKDNMKSSNHKLGTYVGTYYYTGKAGTEDIEVGVRFKIEDYINNTRVIGGSFELAGNKTCDILESVGNPKTQTVDVLQTPNTLDLELKAGDSLSNIELTTERDIDTTSTKKEYTYRSYATQLIPVDGIITSRTGTLDKSSKFGNLKYIQGNTRDIKLSDILNMNPDGSGEQDEFIAESVIITVETGADQKSPILLIVSITGGLVLIAVGIVLIKKFVIK